MVRTERFTALRRLARVVLTQRGLGVVDRSEAIGTADGVAEQVAALVHLARVVITLRVLGVVDRSEAVGTANRVAEQRSVTAVAAAVDRVGSCAQRQVRRYPGGFESNKCQWHRFYTHSNHFGLMEV